jgi:hypothetical protein
MRLQASLLLVFGSAVLSTACGMARGIPIGAPAPARTPDCLLAYEQVSPADAQSQWRQVGDVCVSAPHGSPTIPDVYSPGDLHDLLQEQACELGGEIVTPIGLCTNKRENGIEFGVYVPRT